jgi:DNA-binding beta-propeller fold protein YncE
MRQRPMAMMVAALLGSGLLLTLSGCGGPAEKPPRFAQAWGGRGGGPGKFEAPEGLAVDKRGNVLVADTWNHRVQKFDPAGKLLLSFGSFGDKPGQFNAPRGLAVDSANNILVVDSWNHRVQKFNSKGKFLEQFGSLAASFLGIYPTGLFNYPCGIALDSQNNIFVAEPNASRCQMFDPKGKFLLAWGTAGRQDGQFQQPTGVAVDKDDIVYVLDSDNGRVQKFALRNIIPPPPVVEAESLRPKASGGKAEVVKKELTPAWGGGAALVFRPKAAPARLEFRLKVEDSGNYEIFITLDKGPRQGIFQLEVDGQRQGRPFDAYARERAGTLRTSFGKRQLDKGEYRLAFGLVAKRGGAKGRELTLDSLQLVSTAKERFLGKWGREGKEPRQMLRPRGICFDGEGAFYVADTGNQRVLKYTPKGKLLALWGEQGDKPGEFSSPHAVAASNRDVFVADWGNHRVEKFSF